jgi:glycine C-acetyltransferase
VSTGVGALDFLKDQLRELEEQGLLLHPRTLEGAQGARAKYDGRDVINLASNNYLGLANHPRLNRAAAEAARDYGAGTGAVRTIAGQMTMHRELERRFADFKHAEDSLMFQSGFTSNAGTVAAVLSKQDVIVSDQLNHASIIDGARLSRAEIKVFPHKDVGAADALLKETTAPDRRQLLITDGVFSMDGDIAPLPELVEVAERHGAIMMVDDAHASGVLGTGGAGTVDHFGLHGRVDIQVGTLSKAIGVLGGFIAGPAHLIEWLQNRGRPYLFSTSAPPAVVAACIAALDVIRDEPERLQRLWSNTALFKEGLHELGFDTGASESPITPVITGDEERTQTFARRLFEAGVFAPAIVFPTVARGQARVRTIVTADHMEADLREALETFGRVGRELGLV